MTGISTTSRRSVLAGIGGGAISPLVPLPARGAAIARPPRLRKGDTVGLVCPAGFIADRFGLDEVMETARAMGPCAETGTQPDVAPWLPGRN